MGWKFIHCVCVSTALLAVAFAGSSAIAADTIKREAEAADSISAPMKIYDDPLASGGQYIGTDEGSGDQNSNPPATGVATYSFTAKGGVYKILFRVSIAGGSNSLWVRVVGATSYSPGTHASGWIRFNDISDGAAWHWDEVHSNDHNNQVVQITLPAGKHTLEIARREDGAKLDGFIITDNLALSEASLPAVIDPGPRAWGPDPADGALGVNSPLLKWNPGDGAVLHNVYFGTSAELTEANRVASNQTIALYWHIPGLEPGVTYHWRVDEIAEDGVTVHTGKVWSFTAEPLSAFAPTPADSSEDIFPAPALTWRPGRGAIRHHVYFSNVFADVNDGAAAADQGEITETTYRPGLLRASTTYHWRVNEVLLDNSVRAGTVWSFTTEDGVKNKIVRQWWLNIGGTAIGNLTSDANYPNNPSGTELLDTFEGPVDWADNYGTRMYGWLTPPESGEYTFWVAGDDATELHLSTDADPAKAAVVARVTSWTNSREWAKEAGQKSAPITLQAGQKYFIQALGKEGGGGDNIAVSWQGPGIAAQTIISAQYVDAFALPPLQAFSPYPANGEPEAPQDAILSWGAGEQAQKHDVYLGADEAAVAAADASSPLFKGSQTTTTFDPGALEWNKTYYWRIDETGGAGSWKGNVWSFTTADFLVIDDFESYNDEENKGTRIYETWIDGITNQTTSTVGNWDPPFAERTIVHSGNQSMPLDYNNANSPYYAEASLPLAPAQNWSANGVTDLSLWVHGRGAGFAELPDGTISMSGAGTDIWGTTDEFRYAYKTLNGDGSIVARVAGRGPGSNTWAKAGVMVRETLDANSKHMIMALTGGDGGGIAFQGRQQIGGSSSSLHGDITAAPPYWVKLTRAGNTLTAHVSADGVTWQLMADTSPDNTGGTMSNPIDVPMAKTVLIGLAVTSHAAGELRTFTFDNVSTTGNVTGSWKVQDIGVAQGAGNARADLYVTLTDSTNKTATVKNPDAGILLSLGWNEWRIPLSGFTGVNLTKVKQLTIGIGDKTPDGGGRIYVDDIRVTRPAPGAP